ncbi:hypothetical protein J437_LFUL016957 [Ladona fulva]|uniref:Uncharacterized protein n=1 Tax=Ladona fulva TaxID=123851 RepID=A0A8K0P7X2_LADFU|nr:hypothetical protein J437_LFUL016957 [Ladona fulva]
MVHPFSLFTTALSWADFLSYASILSLAGVSNNYVGVPTNTTMQNAEQPGAVPFQQPPPAAPPIGFFVPPTSGGLPPVGSPYPGAPAPMQYPPQPHQYPTVAAPYPVQPQVMESPPPYNSLFPKDKN